MNKLEMAKKIIKENFESFKYGYAQFNIEKRNIKCVEMVL